MPNVFALYELHGVKTGIRPGVIAVKGSMIESEVEAPQKGFWVAVNLSVPTLQLRISG